ncbi:MAG: 3-hydroxyacyl-CoA dehydrogenase NAD-binding domain-containing protein, partial [Desulfovermiculus sp.]
MDSKMTVGVVGAGNMGSGIAQKLAQEGLDVILQDMKQDFVDRGLANIRKTLQQGVERKILTPEQVEETMARIQGTDDPQDLVNADLIIEAIFEDEKVKKDLFANLDRICAPKTILATNTSSFYVSELAKATNRPDRFVGMHYFYHPAKNRLLEIIPHEGTSQETVNKVLEVGRLHGKTTIVVKDDAGFCVNQFFSPFLTEAVHVLQEGIADIPTIEEAAKRAFKIGMGPFELMNVTGIPIAVHASTTMGKELGSLWDTPGLLRKQMDSGEQWDLSGQPDESKFQTIQDRLYGACLGAAASLVSKGVASIEDTDRGAKVGLRWAKGPFELINDIGIDKAYELIKDMTKRYSDFQLPEIIEKQKQQGKPFTFRYVDLDIQGNMARITLNRPEAMNALNEVTVDQLEEAFTQAENDPSVACIVFQGAGKAFVAGADIRFFIQNIESGRI